MFKKVSEFALVALTGLFAVAPVLAQSSTSRIDSEHSTARAIPRFDKESETPMSIPSVLPAPPGVVKLNSGDSATPDFDFTIYPADKNPSLARSAASRREE